MATRMALLIAVKLITSAEAAIANLQELGLE
jgi:hypothetical protein